ncbi:MAG: pilus assembly protein PilM [Planctomycetota bacterium]
MASTGTGVVIGSHSLKVVQARKKGPVLKLTRIARVRIDEKWADRPFDARKQEYINSLLTGIGLKPGDAMMGLTGRDLIIRYTHVPPVPDWRLDMLMKFEIEEVSEQSGGEVSADWVRLDIPEAVSGDNTILVALAKNQALLPRIQMLSGAGLKVRGGCPNSIGMFHSFVTSAKIPEDEVTLLMHIGAENTDIAIQKDGRLLFARNVSGGGRLFTEAIMSQFNVKYERAEKMKVQKADVTPKASVSYEDSLAEKVSNAVLGVTGQFVSMVHSSVMFAKAQTKIKDLNVDRVVLTGGGANLKGLSDYLGSNIGLPCEVFDPSGAADLSGLEAEDAEILEQDGAGLAVAMGLASMALDRQAFKAEILPDDYRKRRRFAEREVWMVGAGAVLALLIAILFYTSGRDLAEARAESTALGQKQSDLNRAKTDFDAAQEELARLETKWRHLRDIARTGPAVQRALGLFARVVKEGEFNEIHATLVKTKGEDVIVSPKDDPEDPDGRPGDETSKVHLDILVEFKAEVQPLGRPAAGVYADFVGRMREMAGREKDVTLSNKPLQQGKSFTFTLRFSPPEALEPEPPENGGGAEDGEGEDN